MAIRLGDYVIYGELRNTQHYGTFGIIALQGETEDEPFVFRLELTGDCGPDLKGKAFRFMPREDVNPPAFSSETFETLQMRQIGPTGTMTAQGWVRTMPCSVEEYLQRSRLNEPPPTEWKRRLYLEWFGQNGRVVVEMADPIVEECVREPDNKNDEDDEGDWAPMPNRAPKPDEKEARGPSGLDVTILSRDEDGVHVERVIPTEEDTGDESIPDTLQRALDEEAAAIEETIQRKADIDEENPVAELELMDACLDSGEGEPVGSLLDGVENLPRPEDLDDAAVEVQLKSLLAELAMAGIALHVCDHFTPRDSYGLLLDTILPETTAYKELQGTGWVQNFSTYEYCKACEAEFEADMPDIDV